VYLFIKGELFRDDIVSSLCGNLNKCVIDHSIRSITRIFNLGYLKSCGERARRIVNAVQWFEVARKRSTFRRCFLNKFSVHTCCLCRSVCSSCFEIPNDWNRLLSRIYSFYVSLDVDLGVSEVASQNFEVCLLGLSSLQNLNLFVNHILLDSFSLFYHISLCLSYINHKIFKQGGATLKRKGSDCVDHCQAVPFLSFIVSGSRRQVGTDGCGLCRIYYHFCIRIKEVKSLSWQL